MNYFGKTIIFSGQIYNDKNSIDNVRCELTLDQRDTNNNKVRIFYPSKDHKRIEEITETSPIFISSEIYGRKIFVKSSLVYHNIFSDSEPFVLLSAIKLLLMTIILMKVLRNACSVFI